MEKYRIPGTESGGIYAIVNIEDMRAYVGKAKNLKSRAAQHYSSIESGKHVNKKMVQDKNKLHFIVMCESNDAKELDLLEKVYMYEFSVSGFELYNLTSGTNKEKSIQAILWSIEQLYHSGENTRNAIKEEFGQHIGILQRTKKENRDKTKNSA